MKLWIWLVTGRKACRITPFVTSITETWNVKYGELKGAEHTLYISIVEENSTSIKLVVKPLKGRKNHRFLEKATKECLIFLGDGTAFVFLDSSSERWQLLKAVKLVLKNTLVCSFWACYSQKILFGVTNVLASFQRILQSLVSGCQWRSCLFNLMTSLPLWKMSERVWKMWWTCSILWKMQGGYVE